MELDTLMRMAARQGDASEVASLASQGADLNRIGPGGFAPIHLAACGGHAAAIEALAQAGADIELRAARGAGQGNSALRLAVIHGCSGAVEALVRLGARVGDPDKHKKTELHDAIYASWNMPGMLSRLARACPNGALDMLDASGRSCLHLAIARGQPMLAQSLLQAGADPDAPDLGGLRPLHMAAERGHVAILDMLLQAGADPAAKDALGRSADEAARLLGMRQEADMLAAAAAKSELAACLPEPAPRGRSRSL